jgi:tetratricopeptide (TPR) repeat protein
MAKLVVLFLFFLNIEFYTYSQPAPDCASKSVQDSLIKVFSHRAHKLGVFDPGYITTLDSLIAICPNISEAYQEKAFPFLFNGQYAKAFELEDKAVELDPERWIGYRAYLYCIYSKNYEKSLADFAAAEKIAPIAHVMDHTYAYYFGLCYLETSALDKAETAFLKDIAEQKKGDSGNDVHFNSLFYLGMVYYEMREFELAEKYFKECLHLYDQYPEANFYMGKVLQITGNERSSFYFNKAHESYLEGYRINEPNSARIRYPRQITVAELENMKQK